MFNFELFSGPDGITPNSGLTGPNNTYIDIYIYIFILSRILVINGSGLVCFFFLFFFRFNGKESVSTQ